MLTVRWVRQQRILSIRVLVGTDPVAVRVLITTVVVVVVVVPVGARGGRTDSSSAVSRASIAISRIASGITGDRAAGTARNGVTGAARTTGYGMARPRTSCVMASASAMDPPRVNGAATIATAMETSGAHAPSTSPVTSTATSAAGVGIIGSERGCEKNDGRSESEKITKHGMSSLDMGAVIRFDDASRNAVGTRPGADLRPLPRLTCMRKAAAIQPERRDRRSGATAALPLQSYRHAPHSG